MIWEQPLREKGKTDLDSRGIFCKGEVGWSPDYPVVVVVVAEKEERAKLTELQ